MGTQKRIIIFKVYNQIAPSKEPQTVRVDKGRLVIGSVPSADLKLSGSGVAPVHAVIEVQDQATLFDLASDTGVLVNGQSIIQTVLKEKDEIKIGSYRIVFGWEDAAQVKTSGGKSFHVPESQGRELFLDPKEDLKPLLLEENPGLESIFDYSSTQKRALEVVMSWNGIIMDVEHFVEPEQVTIGDAKGNDFTLPAGLPERKHALIRGQNGSYFLHLDPKMKGVIQKGGQIQSLDQMRQTAASLQDIPFGEKDYSKLSVGDIDFYVSFTAAPPTLKRRKIFEKDAFFFKIFSTSLVMTLFTLLGLFNLKVPDKIEVTPVPERIATILYQPEKYTAYQIPKAVEKAVTAPQEKETPKKTEPVPPKTVKVEIEPGKQDLNKPIPKEINVAEKQAKEQKAAGKKKSAQHAQREGREGEGARAKGREGTRGSRKAQKSSEKQNAASRPSPESGKGRGGGNSQVADQGNLDLLKGASDQILNLLGDSGAKLGKSGNKLKGFGGFTTQGEGGLALSGSGSGGGGTAESLGGLGKKGRGGGRVGTGLGAAGSGSSIIGGKSRVVVNSGGPEETVILGSIDAAAIEAALLAHKDEFRYCYEKEINAENPKLSGRVGTSFVIGPQGRVTKTGIVSSSLQNANAERCILKVIERIDFPKPRGGGNVEVRYPFKFRSVG